MPEKQNQLSPQNERTSRIRDNKRRHRARQKEYISDLERRLAEVREQGVQATKEVQLAAQRVSKQNVRLRELLRRTGFDDGFIDAWVRQDDCGNCDQPRQHSEKEGVRKLTSKEHLAESACQPLTGENNNSRDGTTSQILAVSICASKHQPHLEKTSIEPLDEGIQRSNHASTTSCSISGAPSPLSQTGIVNAPCQLLTCLAKNPAADITQVPLLPVSSEQGCSSNSNDAGVECTAAYRMLMQYANSEEKMDKIAQALEEGCTPSGEGGCRVKKSTVWKALDDVCG